MAFIGLQRLLQATLSLVNWVNNVPQPLLLSHKLRWGTIPLYCQQFKKIPFLHDLDEASYFVCSFVCS